MSRQSATSDTRPRPFWAGTPTRTVRRGHFWVAGERVERDGKTYQRGPMFAEWEAPEEVTRPYPVVLVHGGGFQGTEWLDTPDGRPGWAQRLVEAGVCHSDRRPPRSRPLAPAHRYLGSDGAALLL